MEDRFQVHNKANTNKLSMYGIFDGHGGDVSGIRLGWPNNKILISDVCQ